MPPRSEGLSRRGQVVLAALALLTLLLYLYGAI